MQRTDYQWRQITKSMQSCAISIKKLISVTELLAEHNANIQLALITCCDQLHRMVNIIEIQCEQLKLNNKIPTLSKLFYGCLKNTLNLLSRLLQLVDAGVLKLLLSTNQPTVHFRRLTDVTNFTELTKAYTQLALELMQLIQIISNKPKKDSDHDLRRRTRLIMQQQLSESCIILLLTCCKTCVHYSTCEFTANNRTMLLKQMRKSLNYIQELLLRQFTANILDVCAIPYTQNYFQRLNYSPLSNVNDKNNYSLSTTYLPNYDQLYLTKNFKYFKNPFLINSIYFNENKWYFPNYSNCYNKDFLLNKFKNDYDNFKLININNNNWFKNFFHQQNHTENYLFSPDDCNSSLNKENDYQMIKYDNSNRSIDLNKHSNKIFQDDYYNKKFLINNFSYKKNNLSQISNYRSASNISENSNVQYDRNPLFYKPNSIQNESIRSCKSQNSLSIPSKQNFINSSALMMNKINYTINDKFFNCPTFSYLIHQQKVLLYLQKQYYDNVFTSSFYTNSDDEFNTSNITSSDQCLTIYNLLCSFEELISLSRLTCHAQAFREKISQCLELGAELSHEFTDSPYISNYYRERIILLNERIFLEFNHLLKYGSQMEKLIVQNENIENIISQILRTCTQLKQQLQQATLEQAYFFFKYSNPYELLSRLRNNILLGDHNIYVQQIDLYIEHYEHLSNTIKQLHHIAPTETQQICSKHAQFSISIFAPMVLNAIQTLINQFDPKMNSDMLLANFQVFFDLWLQIYVDIYDLYCLISDKINFCFVENLPAKNAQKNVIKNENLNCIAENQFLNCTTENQFLNYTTENQFDKTTVQPNKPVPILNKETIVNQSNYLPENQNLKKDSRLPPNVNCSKSCYNCCDSFEDNQKNNENLENNLTPAQKKELQQKRSLEDNEILDKLKLMNQLIQTMIEFTKGSSQLKTTQDLFTQAEFFSDEANKFYKIVRHLTFQIPSGQLKKDLLENLDKVPVFVQELMFTIKNNTVGEEATYTKVDMVLKQSDQLLKYVENTAHLSIQCAKRYNLDLESIRLGRISPMFNDETRMNSRSETRRKQTQQSGSDSRRTRVSFLLF